MTWTNGADRNNSWLAPSRNPEARVRLFCLPHAGGGTAHFHGWKRLLPATIDVSPIQIPGRESRLGEPSYTNAEDLIEAIAIAIAEHLDRPYGIFGHSMGALLALDLALRLREHGRPEPEYLFVSGRNALHIPMGRGSIHKLADQEFVDALALRYGGLPQEILDTPEFLEVYLPILRADMALTETYIYQKRPPLTCPLAAFSGKDDRNVSKEGLAAWQEHTTGRFESQWFDGDHFYLNGASRPLLLNLITQRLTGTPVETQTGGRLTGSEADVR